MLVIGLSSDDDTEAAAAPPSTTLAIGPGWTGVRGKF